MLKIKSHKSGFCNRCKDCSREAARKRRENPKILEKLRLKMRSIRASYPEKALFLSARQRAKRYGIEFSIKIEDIIIPEICPVLGLILKQGARENGMPAPNTPSIDRIDNNKGYIKGNIKVISYRANLLKNNASIDEMEKIVAYMKREAVVA